MKIATWNVEWASPSSSKGRRIRDILASLDVDVIVLTEGCEELLPPGYAVDAGEDWGYTPKFSRNRKVLLWSRYTLKDVRTSTSLEIPSGRFISARVGTPNGEFTIFAICIPWKDAHVNSGRRDRKAWQDHQDFVSGLRHEIQSHDGALLIAGDFNQRIPRKSQPVDVFQSLTECIRGLQTFTAVELEKPLIDHIVGSTHFSSRELGIISDHDEQGKLSDHRGVWINAELIL